MPDRVVVVKYHLPKSVIRISGTHARSWVVDWGVERIVEVVDDDVTVQVAAVADSGPRGHDELGFLTSGSKDTAYTVSLHPDGRLKTFTATQDSRLAEVIGAAAKLLGVLGGAAVAIANPAAGVAALATAFAGAAQRGFAAEDAPEPTRAERAYRDWAEAFPRHAERGQQLYRTLRELDGALSQAAVATVTDKALGEAWAGASKLRDTLADELAALEESARGWLTARQPAVADSTYVAGLKELFRLPVAEAAGLPQTIEPAPDDLTKPWVEKLKVLIGIRMADGGGRETDPTPSTYDDVWVRLPRPATLGIYVPGEAPDRWVLRQTIETGVVDDGSRTIALPVDPVRGGDASTVVEISESGLPTTIGVTSASRLGSFAEAVDAGVTGLGAGLGQAKTALGDLEAIRTSAAALRAARTERRIADLERQKRLAEGEAAVASEVSTRSAAARRRSLEAELAVLQAEVGIAEAHAKLRDG